MDVELAEREMCGMSVVSGSGGITFCGIDESLTTTEWNGTDDGNTILSPVCHHLGRNIETVQRRTSKCDKVMWEVLFRG
jgi:hypothetical protein